MADSDRLIDLNAVIAPDIRVELGEKTYRLPGDAPTEDLLRLIVKVQELDEAQDKTPAELLEMRDELAADVEDLFRLREPDLPEGEIRLNDVQLNELLLGLTSIYSDALRAAQEAAQEGGGARPTRTQPKPRSARRSRTSSAGRGKRKASASSTSSRT